MLVLWKVYLFLLICILCRLLMLRVLVLFFLLVLIFVSCSSGLCSVVCKRDVVSGACCVAGLVGTKRVKCIAKTKDNILRKGKHGDRTFEMKELKMFLLSVYCVVLICLQLYMMLNRILMTRTN